METNGALDLQSLDQIDLDDLEKVYKQDNLIDIKSFTNVEKSIDKNNSQVKIIINNNNKEFISKNIDGEINDKAPELIGEIIKNNYCFDQHISDDNNKIIKDKVYQFNEKEHGMRMTENLIKNHCKKEGLYVTPHLNDVLYLHYKGFSYIENLSKYTGLKCLWLENNGIREIANLSNQAKLKSLYLHHNLISRIENLEHLTELDTLNLAHNTIKKIENLDCLKVLNTLNLSYNYLKSVEDIDHLKYINSLSVVDVSHNQIESPEVIEIFSAMKSLRVLTLMGNPVVRTIKPYRKLIILKCKNLCYLDDRPVFPIDRACALAWERGGAQQENQERQRLTKEEHKKLTNSICALINIKSIEEKNFFQLNN
ncbi:dynein axonemal assembly factor 1 [Cotesia glomerata]|uniref:Dynein axonemal assembly factor 1 homolog n=1 Tax=Cotesia glomerata TaxID=32391 RepID=A0AAV7IDN1_COTGL|nr:dynein axonemal assembly factor 1 [Cotesia glomerata]KAH0547488.1 Dynein assembly factor 1, axonemal [Cotesia glomerata]